MDSCGAQIRLRRRKLGLTLQELALRTQISKPYLSLIENDRIANPPADHKLQRLEQVLAFNPGELVGRAHLQRTPQDVQAALQKLMGDSAMQLKGIDLDQAYLSGVLQQMVEQASSNVETIQTNAIPVINRVSAGYPSDFTDLSYPPKVADEYVGCPDVNDKDAFAARVHGDSMMPKYRPGDIVIFSPAAQPREGDDCFVRFSDGRTTFKRVFFETDSESSPMLRLQPRNEKYRPQVVPADGVSGLYRALYKYQKVDEQ